MSPFFVYLTPDAEKDLIEIRNYISLVLKMPDTAKRYLHFLHEQIENLCFMPERFPLMEAQPWCSLGVRSFIAKNFVIYYRINDKKKIVFILNIIYRKRDQLTALRCLHSV